jgi:hypothetical protein
LDDIIAIYNLYLYWSVVILLPFVDVQ